MSLDDVAEEGARYRVTDNVGKAALPVPREDHGSVEICR